VALLIDTDLLVNSERGTGDEVATILGAEDVAISVITMSELLHGVARASGGVRARRAAFVEHLLAALYAIPITEPVAWVHAQIWADMAAAGVVVGAHDLWIAATAVAHGLGVATRNAREFERVPGLRVVSPG
jgi:tRNA(fMet)-specific endonuclease VapC